MRTAAGEWLQVMQLEVARFAAALTTSVDETAAAGVALVHFTPQRGRNVATPLARSTALARFGVRVALARR